MVIQTQIKSHSRSCIRHTHIRMNIMCSKSQSKIFNDNSGISQIYCPFIGLCLTCRISILIYSLYRRIRQITKSGYNPLFFSNLKKSTSCMEIITRYFIPHPRNIRIGNSSLFTSKHNSCRIMIKSKSICRQSNPYFSHPSRTCIRSNFQKRYSSRIILLGRYL